MGQEAILSAVTDPTPPPDDPTAPTGAAAPAVEVVIEIPRGSFVKRGTRGRVDFVSPFPCPFNYGSIPAFIGGDGDLLDALVLGPRLAAGALVTVPARGAVGLTDRGIYDDKLVCSRQSLVQSQQRAIVTFFTWYAGCKRLLNLWRGRPGVTRCEGWQAVDAALARAEPRHAQWRGPRVPY